MQSKNQWWEYTDMINNITNIFQKKLATFVFCIII